MILSDREIKKALANESIVIDPAPALDAFASTSVDLTLDARLQIFRTGTGVIIDPGMPGYQVKGLARRRDRTITISAAGWDFAPGRLVRSTASSRAVSTRSRSI
jgi:deoxycytidine triphosphate deaminase